MAGINLDLWMTKMASMIVEAPEELRFVLDKVKMNASKADNMKSLGATSINVEMLANTLSYLMAVQVTDESITRLLKEGKKDMIIREVVNLMPMPCVTCNRDSEFKPGDKPQVRCKRCSRGACVDCFPEPKNGWTYLCKVCDDDVQKQQCIPEALLTAKQKKGPGQAGPQVPTQNNFELLSDEEGEDAEWEEVKRRREDKRRNEEGRGGSQDKEEEGRRRAGRNEEGRRKLEKENEVCKSFKFGGKCPHGMNGTKKYNQWEKCNRSHPKVCNRLLTHGSRGSMGCDLKECEKYHPKMCYSSMNTKICTKDKCTYWHCKGTRFSPESTARYEAPSRASLSHYPRLPAGRSRLPGRREEEERHRPREEDLELREREGRSREGEQERGRREERSREEERRDVRRREENKREDKAGFLDLAQLIRQEVQ